MDRNYNIPPDSVLIIESLSARRAWIEILKARTNQNQIYVALRKESVDRNRCLPVRRGDPERSLSARRAWIEIIRTKAKVSSFELSLSARRAWIEILISSVISRQTPGRSPQGERG